MLPMLNPFSFPSCLTSARHAGPESLASVMAARPLCRADDPRLQPQWLRMQPPEIVRAALHAALSAIDEKRIDGMAFVDLMFNDLPKDIHSEDFRARIRLDTQIMEAIGEQHWSDGHAETAEALFRMTTRALPGKASTRYRELKDSRAVEWRDFERYNAAMLEAGQRIGLDLGELVVMTGPAGKVACAVRRKKCIE